MQSRAVSPVDVLAAPKGPGVYAWWSKEAALGGVPGTPHGDVFLYYVGKATLLRCRLRQHASAKTRCSTLRTTLAALWRPQFGWATVRVRTNPRAPQGPEKYRMVLASAQDEAALSELIARSLIVSWVEHADAGSVERGVIERLSPPLNLQNNDHHPSYSRVAELRRAFNASATHAAPPNRPRNPTDAAVAN